MLFSGASPTALGQLRYAGLPRCPQPVSCSHRDSALLLLLSGELNGARDKEGQGNREQRIIKKKQTNKQTQTQALLLLDTVTALGFT